MQQVHSDVCVWPSSAPDDRVCVCIMFVGV